MCKLSYEQRHEINLVTEERLKVSVEGNCELTLRN